jgi:hypothetical protein
MTQTQRLLEYLRCNRSINPLQAWTELGIYRLAARVNDLKKAGECIESGAVEVKNRYGEECRVAEYRLAEQQLELRMG